MKDQRLRLPRLKREVIIEISYANLFQQQDRLLIAHDLLDFVNLALTCPETEKLIAPFVFEALSLQPWELMHNRQSIPINANLLRKQLEETEKEAT